MLCILRPQMLWLWQLLCSHCCGQPWTDCVVTTKKQMMLCQPQHASLCKPWHKQAVAELLVKYSLSPTASSCPVPPLRNGRAVWQPLGLPGSSSFTEWAFALPDTVKWATWNRRVSCSKLDEKPCAPREHCFMQSHELGAPHCLLAAK